MGKKVGRPPESRQEMVQALVEAAMIGDRAAATKYGVSLRTLQRYRQALQSDPSFGALFERTANTLLTRPWADDLNDALKRTVAKMLELVEKQPALPESLEAVVKAFAAMSELELAREVLGASNRQPDAAAPEAGRPAPPAPGSYN